MAVNASSQFDESILRNFRVSQQADRLKRAQEEASYDQATIESSTEYEQPQSVTQQFAAGSQLAQIHSRLKSVGKRQQQLEQRLRQPRRALQKQEEALKMTTDRLNLLKKKDRRDIMKIVAFLLAGIIFFFLPFIMMAAVPYAWRKVTVILARRPEIKLLKAGVKKKKKEVAAARKKVSGGEQQLRQLAQERRLLQTQKQQLS